MRGKVIYRIACGTCSVCMTYSLILQAIQSGDSAQAAAVEWAASPAAAVQTAHEVSSDPYAGLLSGYYDAQQYGNTRGQKNTRSNSGKGGKRVYSGYDPSYGGQAADDGQTAQEEDKKNTETTSENNEQEQTGTSGDPPTLAQFLSAMRCGGCRHNCCLLSPRCMKGKTKMQNATMQYQQTYGG